MSYLACLSFVIATGVDEERINPGITHYTLPVSYATVSCELLCYDENTNENRLSVAQPGLRLSWPTKKISALTMVNRDRVNEAVLCENYPVMLAILLDGIERRRA